MISVIILTHNRLLSLKTLLDALQKEKEQFEIVLINNSTSKKEKTLVADYDNIHYISMNANVDLSQARNLGMNASEGEYLAFIDDDCIPKKGWLSIVKQALEHYDAVGGQVLSMMALRYPWWWDQEYNWIIGLSTPAMIQDIEGMYHMPQTSNLALKRKVAQKVQFREFSNHKLKRRREDALFWKDIHSAKFKTRIIPEMVVYHRIPQDRLALSYCLKRSYEDGIFRGYFNENKPTQMLKFGLRSTAEMGIELLRFRPRAIITHTIQVCNCIGYTWGLFLKRMSNN